MATGEEKPAKRKTKSAFIRSQPDTLSAKEVVDRAKKAGFTIGEKYVYVIRSASRKKAGKGKRVAKVAAAAAPAPAAETGNEREFRRLALHLGLKRADELLTDTKQKSAALVAGK